MRKVLVLVPFPLDEQGVANRRAQLREDLVGPDMTFTYKPVTAGPALYDSWHDLAIADVAMLEAGMDAEEEGYAAVCIDTMSDSGMTALRSVLDIPVIGPGQASFQIAGLLGEKYSVVTQWDGWLPLYKKAAAAYRLDAKFASARSINVFPDVSNLLGGKEEDVFPKLLEASLACIEEDGADVICLGSTTMHQAHGWLAERLPVPIINPGQLTYKLADMLTALGLTQSRRAYRRPDVPKKSELREMMRAAAAVGVA